MIGMIKFGVQTFGRSVECKEDRKGCYGAKESRE